MLNLIKSVRLHGALLLNGETDMITMRQVKDGASSYCSRRNSNHSPARKATSPETLSTARRSQHLLCRRGVR